MTEIKQTLEGFFTSTRTDKTKEKYLARATQLIKRAKKDFDINEDDEIDVRQFVVWLSERKKDLSRSTWRQYKSSVVYYLENHHNIQESTEALEFIKEITSNGALLKTERTSSLKLKKISYEDYQKLENYFLVKNKKWHKELSYWLRASIITGLRPIEWKEAILEQKNDEYYLKVKNAKNTNGRSHGPTRTLLLKNLTEEDLKSIKKHLNNVRTFIGMDEYDYFYSGCAIALYKSCRKCWPKRKRHITLYSTRHQFSANAKSSGFSKIEVAALMGHAVDITATIHYGKKTAGNEEIGIAPLSDDVSRVKQTETPDFKTGISGAKTKQEN